MYEHDFAGLAPIPRLGDPNFLFEHAIQLVARLL